MHKSSIAQLLFHCRRFQRRFLRHRFLRAAQLASIPSWPCATNSPRYSLCSLLSYQFLLSQISIVIYSAHLLRSAVGQFLRLAAPTKSRGCKKCTSLAPVCSVPLERHRSLTRRGADDSGKAADEMFLACRAVGAINRIGIRTVAVLRRMLRIFAGTRAPRLLASRA